MPDPVRQPVVLEARYDHRVWGGQRLKPSPGNPIGEAWVVYDQNRITHGPHSGKTLAEVVSAEGKRFLGTAVRGNRFPLLIKLLDVSEWLSLQVHPNDAQAERLAGPGQLGKTEAWHVIEAQPGAKVICGVKAGTTADVLTRDMGKKALLDHVEYLPLKVGETALIEAGTLHAIGPGLMLYEVQQSSDITYRAYDWDRPLASGRKLHVDESAQVTNPALRAVPRAAPAEGSGVVSSCEKFVLERFAGTGKTIDLAADGSSFHALTVIEGAVQLTGTGFDQKISRFESVVLPADAGAYSLKGSFVVLRARVGAP